MIIPDESACASIVTKFAPRLPDMLLPEALAATRLISDENCRNEGLIALAPRVSETLLLEMFATAMAITGGYGRAKVLGQIVPRLPDALLPEAFAIAKSIPDENAFADAFVLLGPGLPDALLPEALAIALSFPDTNSWQAARRRVLAAITARQSRSPSDKVSDASKPGHTVSREGRSAGKYDPLRQHLESQTKAEIEMDFSEIEQLLGSKLPPSAHKHRAWWANEQSGSHTHCQSWLNAGYGVDRLDVIRKHVVFSRSQK